MPAIFAIALGVCVFLTGLGAQIGVRLAASSETADDKVTLYLDGRPAAEALALVARQFGFQWQRSHGGYELAQDLAARAREAALRESGRAAQITAIQARMGRVASIVSTPRASWEARLHEVRTPALVVAGKLDQLGFPPLVRRGFDALGGSGTSRFTVGPVISWPFLNLGRVKAGVDAARAREAEAGARYQQAVLRATEEVESSLIGYRKARERLHALEQAAAASQRAAELARLRFEAGAADFLQVLDAERTKLEAEDRLAQGRTEATASLVTVYRALRGSWPMPASGGR